MDLAACTRPRRIKTGRLRVTSGVVSGRPPEWVGTWADRFSRSEQGQLVKVAGLWKDFLASRSPNGISPLSGSVTKYLQGR